MRFTKLHGYGNDYLVCEARDLEGIVSLGAFARRICERHRGAGADGVAIIGDSRDADFSLRIFNPDGGEAAMSGNGSRCAAAYLYHHGLWRDVNLSFATRAGVKRFQRHESPYEGRGTYKFTAEIGRPVFESREIPMRTPEPMTRVRDYPLPVANAVVSITALQMCNPNVIVFVNDFDELDWRAMGRLIETHAAFPERTNVEFVRVRDRYHIEARVWERGVGCTESSGTGASAAAVASMMHDKVARRVTVEMPGGQVTVEWRADDTEVLLTGTAHVVYEGTWKGKHER